jgi:recombination protein RecA
MGYTHLAIGFIVIEDFFMNDADRQAKIQDLKKVLGKKYKSFQVGEYRPTTFISTGVVNLDRMLGGGLPEGKIIEIYGEVHTGKTTLCWQIIKAFQEQGHLCAYIDVERSTPVHTMQERCGVNNELVIVEPSYAEEAVNFVFDFFENGGKLAVIDSLAAMQPKKILEEEDLSKANVASLALLMSNLQGRILDSVGNSDGILVFINQNRQKIGVMYGSCFHEDTPVLFSDGTTPRIRDVVEQQLTGPVVSFNKETNKFEDKFITNWFNNGILDLENGEKWLSFSMIGSSSYTGGKPSFTCTPNHRILLPDNTYTTAGELKVGDQLVSSYLSSIESNEIYKDIIFGSLLGDGMISKPTGNICRFRLQNREQPEYLEWKIEKLKDLKLTKIANRYESNPRFGRELLYYRHAFYQQDKRFIKSGLKLTPLMAAVWYMDDGHLRHNYQSTISVYRWTNTEFLYNYLELLVEFLDCSHDDISISHKKGDISLKKRAAHLLCDKIKTFVPPSMQYKLLPEYRGYYQEFDSGTLSFEYKAKLLTIETIETTNRKLRAKTKYDIEVEGNHNYMVGGQYGVVVSNSETQPGGMAVKYMSSIRLRISRGQKSTTEEAYSCKVKGVKNRFVGDGKECEFLISLGGGVDVISSLVEEAIERDIIYKAGSWIKLRNAIAGIGEDNHSFGQGVPTVINFLKENPEAYKILYDRLI